MISRNTAKVDAAKAFSADAAMDSLARLLVTRERSAVEVQGRLRDKGYKPQAISSAIDRALACGLLDDQRFGCNFVKDRLSRGWGQQRIEQELLRFGIVAENIKGYPHEYITEENQLERALDALKKHRTNSKNPQQSAYRFLIGRGYSSDIASTAAKQVRQKRAPERHAD